MPQRRSCAAMTGAPPVTCHRLRGIVAAGRVPKGDEKMTIQMLAGVAALMVHLFVCAIGARWGGERGRAGEGFFLALFFSVFGLIAIASQPMAHDFESEKTRDEIRGLERRLGAILAELAEQGATQNAIASSTLASAKLLAIVAKGVESSEG